MIQILGYIILALPILSEPPGSFTVYPSRDQCEARVVEFNDPVAVCVGVAGERPQ